MQRCLVQGKDHRVASVAVRLVGRLAGEENVFHELRRTEPEVLQYVVKGYQGDEGLLRCSCVDAIRGFIGSEEGALWYGWMARLVFFFFNLLFCVSGIIYLH